MDPKAQGKYHHGDLRRALIESAIGAIDEVGPHKFSLRALAHDLNVSHAAAYRHFRNKDDLLVAVAIEGLKRLAAELVKAAEGSEQPAATLQQGALAYMRFGLDNPGLYQVMFSGITQRNETSRAAADGVMAMTAQLFVRAQQAGSVLEDDPYQQARAAWAMLHGLIDLEQRKQFGEREREEVMSHAEAILLAFLKGLSSA